VKLVLKTGRISAARKTGKSRRLSSTKHYNSCRKKLQMALENGSTASRPEEELVLPRLREIKYLPSEHQRVKIYQGDKVEGGRKTCK
jgi:hypothetical protein